MVPMVVVDRCFDLFKMLFDWATFYRCTYDAYMFLTAEYCTSR